MYDEAKKYVNNLPNPNYNIHKISLPFRAVLIGSSGSGKTNTALSIVRTFGATFEKIVIATLNAYEPLYLMLQDKHPEIEFFENEVPDLDTTFKKDYKTIYLLDTL